MFARWSDNKGISIVSAVIVLPILISILVLLFDLGKIYLTLILAKQVALTAAKFAVSYAPDTSIPALNQLIKAVPGESGSITSGRQEFWNDQIDPTASTYHGLPYFTDKELRVFNLIYGYIEDLNTDIAFPIPASLSSSQDLNGRVNCSVYFEFADLVDPSLTDQNYSRIYHCRCVVPLVALGLVQLSSTNYSIVEEQAYAYRSGDIIP